MSSGEPLWSKGIIDDESESEAEGGRVEHNGTANANMEFCFGRTVSRKGVSDDCQELSSWDQRTFQLIFLCHHFKSIFRFVYNDTRKSN